MASKGAVEALARYARLRSPSQIYRCPTCRRVLQPGEVREDHDETSEEHGVMFHKPCRAALVLYNRG